MNIGFKLRNWKTSMIVGISLIILVRVVSIIRTYTDWVPIFKSLPGMFAFVVVFGTIGFIGILMICKGLQKLENKLN